MRVDLHNHTKYCNHASGSMAEYVQRACMLGIDVFGFSCHAPMAFDTKYRMDFDTLPRYIDEVHRLQESMDTGGMEILCALEVDYILGREDLLARGVLAAKLDYLIGSVHFLGTWGFDNPEFVGEWHKRGIEETWNLYLDSMDGLVRSGHFQVIGHLDLPKIFGARLPSRLFNKLHDILELARDFGLVLEVNASGLRKPIGEQYPSLEILNAAREIGMHITLGSDAHEVDHVGYGYSSCLKIIKDLGFREAAVFRDKTKILVDLD